jgi:predicted transcriptional regulator
MAVSEPKQLRDFTLSVRLRPDMRERLAFVSDALGVSPATVASMAIGQYVAAQHASLNASKNTIESVMEKMLPEFMENLKNLSESEEEPCLSSKVSSVQLPLLAAESTKKPAKSSRFARSSKSKPSIPADSSK